MLRLREVDKKIAEMQKTLQSEFITREQRQHLESLIIAYQKERLKALVRSVDDKYYDDDDVIPRGMYR